MAEDFSRTAELNIVIPDRELRAARDELEDALADIPVGVSGSAGAGGRTSGGGGGSGINRRDIRRLERKLDDLSNEEVSNINAAQLEVARKNLSAQRASVEADKETDDTLNDILDEIRGGSAGGGGAREQRRRRREFRWARQRTDDVEAQLEVLENIEGELTEGGLGGGGGLLGDVIGVGGEGAGIATDIGTSLVDLVAPALGSLVGTFLGQQTGGGDGGGGGGGPTQPPTVTIERPGWVPLQATRPEWVPLAVEEQDDTFWPDPPEFDLPELPDLTAPDPGPVGFEDPPTAPIADPPTLTVEKPEWVPIQVDAPTTTGPEPRLTPRRRGRDRGDPLANDDGTDSIFNVGGEGGITFGPGGLNFGGDTGVTVGRDPRQDLREQRSGGGGAPSAATASAGSVNVTMQVDVQNAVQEAMDRVRREQERQRQELRRDLERQISDLERQITSGGGGRSTTPGRTR